MKMEQEEGLVLLCTHCVPRKCLAQRHSLRTDLRYITVAGSEESGWGWAKMSGRPVRSPLEELWWKFRMRVA